MPRFVRPALILIYDAAAAAIALLLALLLRFDGILPEQAANLPYYAAPYAIITIMTMFLFGMHRSVLRYTAARDVMRLIQAVTITVIVATVLLVLVTRFENFPRSVVIIGWLLHLALAATPRVGMRLLVDNPLKNRIYPAKGDIENALIIGVDDSTDMFLREVQRQVPQPYNVVGFLDDETSRTGMILHGVKVLGHTTSLEKILSKFSKKGIKISLLILGKNRQNDLEPLLQVARRKNITMRRLPSISSLESGENLTNLKPVLIEDILGRNPHEIDLEPIRQLVGGKKVLVTGAGGSIGSEICRQIASYNADSLIMADHSEFNLYQIDQEITKSYSKLNKNSLLSDVSNENEINDILEKFDVDVIFHAAAYKHVHLVEENPISGLKNNFFGTISVANAAIKHKIKTMVVISTDKAVNPTNVMGATKRAAEIYCQNKDSTTNFITVRFGNVIGSSGSAIPLFQKQIQQGGPITVTDKRAERYFMTIPEAVKLTLRAAALGTEKGHKGDVFMLDMGEPVTIWNVAEEMVRLSGLVPHVDIEINEIGLRPGEKLKEELWYKEEKMSPTELTEIFRVEPVRLTEEELQSHIKKIAEACHKEDNFKAVKALRGLVSEYQPANNSPFAHPSKSVKRSTD